MLEPKGKLDTSVNGPEDLRPARPVFDGDAWERVLELRRDGPSRHAFRRLQRYTVSLQPHEIARLKRLGVLEPLLFCRDESNTSWVLKRKVFGVYDERFGFGWQGGERFEPENFIVG